MMEIASLKRFLRHHAENYPLASAVITAQLLVGFAALLIQIAMMLGGEQ